MDNPYQPHHTEHFAPGGYRADAREARTDLLLGGFSVAKAACAAVMYFAVMFAAASRHPSSALLFLGGASAAAASLVAIDRAADVLAKRRGRPARDLAALGMQAAKIVRLFWFMPLIPLLASTGLPLLPRLVLSFVAVGATEIALERLFCDQAHRFVFRAAPRARTPVARQTRRPTKAPRHLDIA